MWNKTVLALTFVSSFSCSVVWADEVADIIGLAQKVVDCKQAEIYICLDRRDGVWGISGLSIDSDILTRHDLESLSAIKSLTDLGLGGNGRPPTGWSQYLATLPHLRRFGTSWFLNKSDLYRISLNPSLRELVSTSYSDEGFNMDGLNSLKHLQTLNLAGRKLEGNWANLVKELTQLVSLDLRRNEHISDQDLSELRLIKNLRELKVGQSKEMTDIGLAALKNFTDLRSLEIPILGPIGLEALKNCSRLERLAIGNYSPGQRSSIADLSSVKWISVEGVSGGKQRAVQLPTGLTHLGLRNDKVVFFDLQSAKNVEQVDVSLARVDDQEDIEQRLDWLRSLPMLRELSVYQPREKDMKSISKLKQLRRLRVTGEPFSPIGNKGVQLIGELLSLESLEIDDYFGPDDGVLAVNSGVAGLCKLVQLQRLVLHGLPAISAKNLCKLSGIKKLKTLEIDITDQTSTAFEGLLGQLQASSELDELTIMRTKLDGQCLKKLGDLKSLRRLQFNVADNVTDEDITILMRTLPALQSIRIWTHRGSQR